MARHNNPKIVTDGLLLYYDMANAQKSWKGAPTTNLITNPLPANVSDYIAAGGTGTMTYDSATSSIKWVRTAYETWGAYIYLNPMFNGNLSTSLQYSISFEWRTENPSLANSVYTYELVQGSGVSSAVSVNILANSTLQSNGWYFFKYTFTPANTGISAYNRVIIYGSQGSNVSTFYLRKFQLEQQAFASPFIVGTRANTQAILDLTNNNTLTVSNLTYTSNNTFSFNGTNGYINVPSTTLLQFLNRSPYTFEQWVYPISDTSASYPGFINRESNPGTGRDGYNLYYTNVGQTVGTHYIGTERWGTGTAVNIGVSLSDAVFFNNWHCFCTTYDGSTLRFYRNGSLITSGASTQNITNTTQNVTIGQRGGVYSNSQIATTRMYNIGLTASQVLQNFNAQRSRFGV